MRAPFVQKLVIEPVANYSDTIYKGEYYNSAYGIVYLNPESITENLSSGWVQTAIPGQRGPGLQWVTHGVRTISFSLLVTKDGSHNVDAQRIDTIDRTAEFVNSTTTQNSSPAIKKAVSAFQRYFAENGQNFAGMTTYDLGIYEKLEYYRSLISPHLEKDNLNRYVSAPVVTLKVTGDNDPTGGNYLPCLGNLEKPTYWIITKMQIRHSAFDANQEPIEATCKFTLVEYVLDLTEEQKK